MTAEERLKKEDRDAIAKAITHAEAHCSGQIRLFVEDVCGENVLDRAAFIFGKLDMHKTKHRNGVLIYLAFESRQFAIIGDAGIHEKVGDDFWNDIKAGMKKHFAEGDFVKGLTHGIVMSGNALKKHFPHHAGDKNELSDDIVFKVKKIP